jgi:hypothetical protein
MPFLPNVPRCQHLKVNGTQCGSPALKRNRFCFFHKRFQEEQIKLNCDRTRRGRATFLLPVLEDANSIQISLMQIMRLLASGQMDSKIAGLLLFALQTASYNLRRTTFEPIYVKDVVIDRRTIDQTCIGGNQWSEEDFPDPELTEQEKAEAAADEAAEAAADAAIAARAAAREKARRNDALEAEADRIIREGAAQRAAAALRTPPPSQSTVPTHVETGTLASLPRAEPRGPVERSSTGSATKPVFIPPIPSTQPLHPSAEENQPTADQKQSTRPPRRPPKSAKLNKKKTPRNVDMNEVRERIRGKVHDWVMSTARQSNQPESRNGRPPAKGERLRVHT